MLVVGVQYPVFCFIVFTIRYAQKIVCMGPLVYPEIRVL
jgi:hypothetical protein